MALLRRLRSSRAARGAIGACVAGAGALLLRGEEEAHEDLSRLSQSQLLERSVPFDDARFEALANEARRASLFHAVAAESDVEAAIIAWHDAHESGGAVAFVRDAPLACFVYSESEPALPHPFAARRRQVVVVKGTSSASDLLTNLDLSLSTLERADWAVHGGFGAVAAGTLAALRPYLDDAAELHFVGHSLGGAAVTLVALALAAEETERAIGAVLAFGCPRVGYALNARGAALAEALPLLRINTLDDPVPSLPPASLAPTVTGRGFGHVADRQLLLCGGGKYAHLDGETAAQRARAPVIDCAGDVLTYAAEHSFENATTLKPHAMPVYIGELDALAASAARARRSAEAESDAWLHIAAP